MRHIRKALSYSVAGAIGLTVISSLGGCSDQGVPPPGSTGLDTNPGMTEGQNAFLVIEQTGSNPDTYNLLEKHPTSGPTRAILRDGEGNERFLSEDELKTIADQEAAKVEAGESRLTGDPEAMSGGMSFGELLLASAAGSLIGGMLASKLAGNANFQRTSQQYGGKPTSSISQPYNKSKSGSTTKSGFFGGNTSGTNSTRSSFGSYGG